MKSIELKQNENELNNLPKWYIKFNPNNGKILRISPKYMESNSNKYQILISTDADIITKILSGKIPLGNCKVIQDIVTDDFVLVEKSNQLVIQNLPNKLLKIKKQSPSKVNINLEYMTKLNTLSVSLNVKNIKQSMNIGEIQDIHIQDNAVFNLYITKKDNLDALIEVIEVDPVLIFKNKVIKINVDFLDKYDPQQIDFYTSPIFGTYSLQLNNTSETITDSSVSHKYLQTAIRTNEQKHLTIHPLDSNMISINSSLITKETRYLLQSNKFLPLLFCDGFPDHVLGMVEVNCDDLINKNSSVYTLDFKIPENLMVLYQCNTLKINIMEK